MFVQYVLEPLWQVYQAALKADGDKGMLEKVIKNFNLKVSVRELQHKDPKVVLQAVMSRWLPLSDTIFSMVVRCMPDPVSAQAMRISRLIPRKEILDDGSLTDVLTEANHVRECVVACDSRTEAPCVAFASKIFSVPFKMLPHRGPSGEALNNMNQEEAVVESDECFLAFVRIFSGILYAGQKVYVLSTLYDPTRAEFSHKHVQEAQIDSLYLMMGQGLKPVQSVDAGNVVAIRGLGQYILKSATISSTRNCWPFSNMVFQVAPTLRVAIEPTALADMGALTKGLKLLNRADPFVEVSVSSRGEHVLAAAGEVHLERFVKDLQERFARVSLKVSPLLVSYKETIEGEELTPVENMKAMCGGADFVEKQTPNGRCMVRVQLMKLPTDLTTVLNDNSDILRHILEVNYSQKIGNLEVGKGGVGSSDGNDDPIVVVKKKILDAIEIEMDSASKLLDKDKLEKYRILWSNFLERIWALGPHQVGPNVLISDSRQDHSFPSSVIIKGLPEVSQRLGFVENSISKSSVQDQNSELNDLLLVEAQSLESHVIAGFQLA